MMFSGVVVSGKKIGRQIGFPTANLEHIKPDTSLTKGVFAVEVHHDGTSYSGVMNIGKRPTVEKAGNQINNTTIEVHILDFNNQIYGDKLQIKIFKFIRTEKKFNNLEELKAQILKDIETAREILQKKDRS